MPKHTKAALDFRGGSLAYLIRVFLADEVSGSSFDWVKGVAEVPITFLFELRDLGVNGFLLPTEQIIPNNEEIMACLVEMDRTTRRLRYYSGSSTVLASVMSLVLSVGFLVLLR